MDSEPVTDKCKIFVFYGNENRKAYDIRNLKYLV